MFDVAEISELQSKVLIRLIDDDKDFLKSLGLLQKRNFGTSSSSEAESPVYRLPVLHFRQDLKEC